MFCGSNDRKLVCNDHTSYSNKDAKSFVGLTKILPGKTSKTFKTKSLVTYSIHVTLVTFLNSFRCHFLYHGHTLLKLLPVGAQKRYLDDEDHDYIYYNLELTGDLPVQFSDNIPLTPSSTSRIKK